MNPYAGESFVSDTEIQNTPAPTTSPWRDWAQLVRLPNLFTAMADPLAGALIVGVGWAAFPLVLVVMLAGAFLYAGGIVLNDWHDYRNDLRERPERPLPSGRIGRFRALLAAILLLGGGFALTRLVSPFAMTMAGFLVASIVAYDVLLKEVPIAPAIMGTCRALNLLLGMTLVAPGEGNLDWGMRIVLAAVMWLYVTGVTTFGRKEFDPKDKTLLVVGGGMCGVAVFGLLGIGLLANQTFAVMQGIAWLVLLAGAVGNRMASAMLMTDPKHVQQAVKMGVLGIVALNAAMVGFRAGFWASLPVMLLLVPTVILGRRLYTT